MRPRPAVGPGRITYAVAIVLSVVRPFFPAFALLCSARLGITRVLAGISPAGGLVWVGVVPGALLATGLGEAKILPGVPDDFLIEVPPFRRPGLWNVAVKA